MEVSAELLGQSDDDALRTTQEAEPVDVLVLRDLADEFGTVTAQAGNDVVDVVDSEHDAAYAQRVRRRAFRLGSDRRPAGALHRIKPGGRPELVVSEGLVAPNGVAVDRKGDVYITNNSLSPDNGQVVKVKRPRRGHRH